MVDGIIDVARFAIKAERKLKDENKNLRKALFVALSHSTEDEMDETIDVIRKTLEGEYYYVDEFYSRDIERGRKIFNGTQP